MLKYWDLNDLRTNKSLIQIIDPKSVKIVINILVHT